MLRDRDRGMAFVCADTEQAGGDQPIVHTAPWGYLRPRRPTYDDYDLQRWAETVKAQGWERACVFCKQEDDGAGPEMAGRFAEIAPAAQDEIRTSRSGNEALEHRVESWVNNPR